MDSFPIFVKFGERPPLIVGGGELAAAKARLLLKSTRRVTIAAERFAPTIAQLIASGAAEPVPGAGVDQIRNRPFVISATGDLNEDSRVSALARSLGVPVNVPDRPELCSFSLAAIVDRAGVTVAIGTEGAAPVLATQLRASLERELHPRLGRLAAIAREFRDQVGEKLPAGVRRREFWDQVFAGPAAAAILAGDEMTGRRLITELLHRSAAVKPKCGRVLLVGAGPGDPELLTLKAVRALKSADVILHDHLIGEGALEYARREAQIICVGKKKGRHCKSQAEINALIVSLALEGKTVVRLKGGDPFVFGRGGEEVDVLRASGISIEVVPGITAATAAAATLQIPLTHRGVSRSVTFISGHAAGDGRPDFDQLDFRALAASNSTLAVYMGVATAGVLAATMLASGWSPATPVVAVERASLANERRIATTLDVLAEDASRLQLEGPALLICGEVASLLPAGAIERLWSKRSIAQSIEGADA
jgi:uroporphyrin-III C-methyltransferase/precorrin-2 dehydrogenase/sirohydrochlorin ferrochelatase